MDAEDTDLVAKKTSTSVGDILDLRLPTVSREMYCARFAKLCGNTTNLYQHLKQHREKYAQCMTMKTQISKDS